MVKTLKDYKTTEQVYKNTKTFFVLFYCGTKAGYSMEEKPWNIFA